MARYDFSVLAENDLSGIYVYTYKTFGPRQADTYNRRLLECVERLAAKPALGKRIEGITDNYLGYSCQSHVIFYETAVGGILIVRVPHQRMDFRRHL